MSSVRQAIAVFDLDGTLIAGDSFTDAFLWFLQQHPWRVLPVLITALLSWPWLLIGKNSRALLRLIVWSGTIGLSLPAFDAIIARYAASQQKADKIAFLADARACIAEHRAAGHEIVIATAAYEPLARAICAANGLSDVAIIGSSLTHRYGGLVTRRHGYGENKTRMLFECGYTQWDFAYSDHSSDAPLLGHAKQGFVVNATPKCRATLASTLTQRVTFVAWC